MKHSFRIFILASIIGIGITGVYSKQAYALQQAKPLATDKRIRTLVYSPNEIYKFTGHYGFESVIEFESDEEIGTVSLGDSVAWQIVPSGSRLFLKPVEPDAMTNMTIVTSKRTYNFELHANTTDDIDDPEMVFVLRFIYGRGAGIAVSNYMDSVPDPTVEPEKYNFDYQISGADEVAPIRIFDDGKFTYFEFKDKNAEVPAFFLTYGDGSESLINFRARGDYIVVERVAAQFTLRHGEDTVCVFNAHMKLTSSGPAPRKNGTKSAFGKDDEEEIAAEKAKMSRRAKSNPRTPMNQSAPVESRNQ